jgi:PAS domain-containing protein
MKQNLPAITTTPEQMRFILEQVGIGCWTYDIDAGRFIAFSRSLVDLWGRSEEELSAMTPEALFSDRVARQLAEFVKEQQWRLSADQAGSIPETALTIETQAENGRRYQIDSAVFFISG